MNMNGKENMKRLLLVVPLLIAVVIVGVHGKEGVAITPSPPAFDNLPSLWLQPWLQAERTGLFRAQAVAEHGCDI